MSLIEAEPNEPVRYNKPRSPQQLAAKRLTARRKRLVHARVWDGLTLLEAAKATGMSHTAARIAIADPSVRAYEKEQLEVRRNSERSRNLAKMAELRDDAKNQKTQLDAAWRMEQLCEPGRGGLTVNVGVQVQSPGYIVAVPASADVEEVLRLAGSTGRADRHTSDTEQA